jgi:biopolymer transport protein ExbB
VTENGEKAERALVITADEKPSNLLSELQSGYVGIILSSLSVDGWIVIGLLAVMFAVSFLVMIGKATYLRAVGKGNDRFLEEWSHIATDLAKLDAEEGEARHALSKDSEGDGHRTMRGAPLYRIYHIGVNEIRHRVSADKNGKNGGAAKGLSARSIQAIRASLDGGLVRETQRLNSSMVLLTIAISGGPFLGLLGTVVGVMITFAAVAAAGDVNVNAIAPGIAAALAATVAGLAVAIPSLFGYNYLLTRIKAMTSDMHVFIDEFVTKMAEYYSASAED